MKQKEFTLVGRDLEIIEQLFSLSKTILDRYSDKGIEVANASFKYGENGREVKLELKMRDEVEYPEINDITFFKIYYFFLEQSFKINKKIYWRAPELGLFPFTGSILFKRKFCQIPWKKIVINFSCDGSKKVVSILPDVPTKNQETNCENKFVQSDIFDFSFMDYQYIIKIENEPELKFPDDREFFLRTLIENTGSGLFDMFICSIGYLLWEYRSRINSNDVFSFLSHLVASFDTNTLEKEREAYLYHYILWHKLRCYFAHEDAELKKAMEDYVELFTNTPTAGITKICVPEKELRSLWLSFEKREFFIELLKNNRKLLKKITDFYSSRFKFWSSIFSLSNEYKKK
jgi:hypothetical protein